MLCGIDEALKLLKHGDILMNVIVVSSLLSQGLFLLCICNMGDVYRGLISLQLLQAREYVLLGYVRFRFAQLGKEGLTG